MYELFYGKATFIWCTSHMQHSRRDITKIASITHVKRIYFYCKLIERLSVKNIYARVWILIIDLPDVSKYLWEESKLRSSKQQDLGWSLNHFQRHNMSFSFVTNIQHTTNPTLFVYQLSWSIRKFTLKSLALVN